MAEEFPRNPTTAVEAVDSILAFAASERATDIHCDPRERDIAIRIRVDGQLSEIGTVRIGLHEEMIARLKILSGARTDLHVVPQDGRFRTKIRGEDYNVRVSFMPTYHGENAVLRLLPSLGGSSLSFAALGFTPDHVRAIDSVLRLSHGLVLAVGPTGSGKTTTLRTCLSAKVREPLCIVTLEDPVEFEIPGIRQVHVRHAQGVTFASGLRSALRQDPDVIMVGEIRDSETARVAVHTALTGHLVFSTLHTNSALDALPRLIDMGIDRYLLAATLKLIVAQRLVRRICVECAAEGCTECRYSGYAGRSVIAETVRVDAGLKSVICETPSQSVYAEYAYSQGFRPMIEDGEEKIEWGVTTREEVVRALDS